MAEKIMTREQLYKGIKVSKGYHWCIVCDDEANFVITNTSALRDNELPLCKACAEMLKNKIEDGLSKIS